MNSTSQVQKYNDSYIVVFRNYDISKQASNVTFMDVFTV